MNNSKKKIIQREMLTPCTVKVRDAGDGTESRTIEGRAIVFNTPSAPLYQDEESEVREVISPDAVTQELLDESDIKFTMFHDRQLILARSNKGSGTLKYSRSDEGVDFSFDAPHTVDGDKALELVRRGDIQGCSFMFSTYYFDPEYVNRKDEKEGEETITTFTVNKIIGLHDMTLAADPAYPATTVDVRELLRDLKAPTEPDPSLPEPSSTERETAAAKQVAEMRKAAARKIS